MKCTLRFAFSKKPFHSGPEAKPVMVGHWLIVFRLHRKSWAAVTAWAASLKRWLIVFDNWRLIRLHRLTPPPSHRPSASCHDLRPFPLFEAVRYLWRRKSAVLALISDSCVAGLHAFFCNVCWEDHKTNLRANIWPCVLRGHPVQRKHRGRQYVSCMCGHAGSRASSI